MAEKQPISDSVEFEKILSMASPSKSGIVKASAVQEVSFSAFRTGGIGSSRVMAATSAAAIGMMPLASMDTLRLMGQRLIYVSRLGSGPLLMTYLAMLALHGLKVRSKRLSPYA